MALARGPSLAAVLLLLSSGHHCLPPPSPCPHLCGCQSDPVLMDCSSAGLYRVPQPIPDSVTQLHLPHNHLPSVALDQPLHKLRVLRLDNNSITHLSLCLDRTPGDRRGHGMRPWGRQGCESWAPSLQRLSVDRNQLWQLPEGLEGSTMLQVLHVSFNRISSLRPGQFSRLGQLTELHLQHNLITKLHPQIFQGLPQLRVLDLSFNMLTSLHPLLHLSLRNIGAEVTLAGNKWHCDCSLRNLRQRMVYGRNGGLKAWNVVCASPSSLSGRDLLQVEESELNCFSPENNAELHQDITVFRGSEILLSCSAQDSTWLTPNGQAPVGDRQAGLHISDITEGDTGLYVCVSKDNDILSVFNLQISRNKGTKRKARSLPSGDGQISQDVSDRMIQERNQGATQTNLALAVCLSVLITFFVAFIVGVMARPWLDHLWQRITNKNSPTEITVVSVVEQRQYENQAFTCCEEPEGVCNHRERRVTFCSVDIEENSSVQRHDNDRQENINKYEEVKADRDAHKAGDSGSETSSQSSQEGNRINGGIYASISKNTKLEYVQETTGPKASRRHSSSSDSSFFDKGNNIKPSQVSEDSVQQRAPEWKRKDVQKTSMNGHENLGFSTEPFDDWSPHAERFEFSDSVRSVSSSESDSGSLETSKRTDKKKRNDKLSSNSSSYFSVNKIPKYTMNPEQEKEIKWNDNPPEVTKDVLQKSVSVQQSSGESAVISPGLQGDYRYDTQSHAMRPKPSVSSYSSDSEDNTVKQKNSAKDEEYISERVTGEKDTQQKVVPLPRTKLPGSVVILGHGKSPDTKAPTTPAVCSSSSSSESELKPTRQKLKQKRNKMNPDTKVKASGDIKGTSSDSDSSSSKGGSKVETSQIQRQELIPAPRLSVKASQTGPDHHWPAIDLQHAAPVKRRLDIKVKSSGSQSSSSSDSENETSRMKKQDRWQTPTPGPPSTTSSQTAGPDHHWPAINLEHTTKVKRRLDIKVKSRDSNSSSSSDSDHMRKQDQWQTFMPRPPSAEGSQTAGPDHHWPAINFEHATKIRRRLDLKVKSHDSDSSSSSTSEDETNHIKKQQQWETSTRLPVKVSHTGTPDQPWPAIDLLQKTRVKRRLDIKAPSPKSDTSFSGDSEDDRGHSEQQRAGKGQTTKTSSEESSSSSNSEDETPHPIKKVEHWEVSSSRIPVKEPQIMNPDHQWPAVDLQHRTRLKRRLDIKIQSPDLYFSPSSVSKVSTKVDVTHPPLHKSSSSSSDSENDTSSMTKQGQWAPPTTILPNYTPPAGGPEQQWPAVNLEQTTKVKRRLDVKALSPKSDTSSSSDDDHKETQRPGVVHVSQPAIQKSDSSSSSDSDDDTNHITKQEQWQTSTPRDPPIHTPPTGSPAHQWPAVNLNCTTKVKRRLDIKVTSDVSESSSSSDSEDETSHNAKEKEWQTSTTRVPGNTSPTGRPDQQWPAINLDFSKKVKRRLDIRAPLIQPDKSSSSDSEDDQSHNKKQKPVKADITQHPIQESQSSSSSDSEHETGQIQKQEQWQTAKNRLPNHTSPPGSPNQWPVIKLQKTKVKRRLDIRITPFHINTSSSSDSEEDGALGDKQRPGQARVTQFPMQESHSSSSSDSEDQTSHIIKQEQWQTPTARVPINTPPTGSPHDQWPAINLGQTTKVKRRLNIKAPSVDSKTSSSSDSEDDSGHQRPRKVAVSQRPIQESQSSSSSDSDDEKRHRREQGQWQTSTTRIPISTPPTGSPDQRWPSVNLDSRTKIKRRLDIKAPSLKSDASSSSDSENDREHQRPRKVAVSQRPIQESQSSSSSDSDDEKRHTTEQGQLQTSTTSYSPIKVSQTVRPGQQWPAVDLDSRNKIKRRLDIKAPSPKSDTSSSSDSEDDQDHKEKQRPGGVDVSQRPLQESHSSSSSDNEEATRHIKKQEQWQTSIQRLPSTDPDKPWPQLDLLHLTRVRRRLDIKAPSYDSDSSSSSDSEDEKGDRAKRGLGVSIVSSNTPKDFGKLSMMPLIRTSSKPNTDDNVKLENYTNISDTGDKISSDTNQTPDVSPELQSLWAKMNLGKSRFRENLKITSSKQETANPPFTPPPISPHYTSTRRAEGPTYSEFLLEPEDKVQQEMSNSSIGRQRKDSSPSSKSSSSDEEEDGPRKDLGEGWRGQAQSPSQIYLSPKVAGSAQGQTQEVNKQMGMDFKMPAESGPLQSRIVLTNIPRVRRALNVRAPLQMESSSDISGKPDLSHGNPYTVRPLTNEVPAPSSSSTSSSESENETTENTAKQDREGANILGQTDSPIAYRRSIFKSSSLVGSSTLPMGYRKHPETKVGTDEVEGPSGNHGGTEASLRPKTFPSTSFEEIIKTRISRPTKGEDVPPEIKWNGIGRRLTPIPHLRTAGESALTPRQEPTRTDLLLLDDSSSASQVDYNLKIGRSDEVLIPQQWTGGVSNDSILGRNLDKMDTSPSGPSEVLEVESDNRKERKGLSALKAMSSERKQWDTHSDPVSPSQFNGYGSPVSTRFNTRSTEGHKPQTQLPLHSTSEYAEGVRDFLYGIPLYRRHAVEATTPPAVPATASPDEVHIPAWRSPQSSERVLGVRTQPDHGRITGEPNPHAMAEHFDNPYNNISSV